MSDGIDPSVQIRRPRPNEGNSSNGTLAIVLAVVAVVVGFLILRSLNASGANSAVGGGAADPAAVTTTLATGDTTPIITTTTVPTIDFTGATILVANANGGAGTAGKMSDAIKAAGATMVTPTDATSNVDVSQILYNAENPQALKVATSLSKILSPSPAPTPLSGDPPIKGERQGADVILLLGKDLADATVNLPTQPATTLTVPLSPDTATATDSG